MKKRSGNLIFIAVVLILDFVISLGWITGTAMKVKEINELETPVEIAEKYMQSGYDRSWLELEKNIWVNKEQISATIYEYEIYRELEDDNANLIFDISEGWNEFWKEENIDTDIKGVGCSRKMESPKIQIEEEYGDEKNRKKKMTPITIEISTAYFDNTSQIEWIQVALSVWDVKNHWGKEYYELCYTGGQYEVQKYENGESKIVVRNELEKRCGMTIQEIVDIAYEDQRELEETMYEMQGHMLEKRKASMRKKLLWTNGISLILIGLGIVSEIIERRYAEGV